MKQTWKGTHSSLFLILFLAAVASSAWSQAARSGPVEARLVAEQDSVRPGEPFWVALVLDSDQDWHVYWKNPGESGLPTTLEWSLPSGFAAGDLLWPAPRRIESLGTVTYGYPDRVLLLTLVTPPRTIKAGSTIRLAASAGWLACRVECTPGKAVLSLSLPVRDAQPAIDPLWEGAFRSTRALLPSPALPGAFTVESDGGRIAFRARGLGFASGDRVDFLPYSEGQIVDSAGQHPRVSGDSVTMVMSRPSNAWPLSRLQGILVDSRGATARAFEVDAPVGSMSALGTDLLSPFSGLLIALVLAFAGGILLNFMPCVLPVISLKVLSLLRHTGGTEKKGSVTAGLLFAAGVLVSFWAIAGALAGLRAGGRLLGWGFQFQDPIVVAITALLFFLIGLNLFGVFEIGSALSRVGGRLSASRDTGRTRGAAGAFFSGLFAAAVATPCTAPFMGSALGYALAHPFPAALGVFTALGLGMAGPYVVLTAFPRLLARLPAPGKWMETLRQVVGFPMMAAVIWMMFILSALTGPSALIVLLAALLAAGSGAWIWGRWGGLARTRATRVAAGSIALLFVVGGSVAAIGAVREPVTAAAAPAGTTAAVAVGAVAAVPASTAAWETWSPERVAELRARGAPVFVDFTARWCLSCQVNERVALRNVAVEKRFRELGVATLRADWTDRNDQIASALAGFGRAGVPVYALYGRGGRDPVLLPEILTPGIVLAALDSVR